MRQTGCKLQTIVPDLIDQHYRRYLDVVGFDL
jgi:hypothetical protein